MKSVLHGVFLVVGFGLGVWWGVYHPADAARLSDEERRLIDKGKQVIQQEVHPGASQSPVAHGN
jgi:hypothetical protein